MPRESKDAVKRSVSISTPTYEWVVKFAEENGIDYTAAVNYLLAQAKKEIERQDRNKQQQDDSPADRTPGGNNAEDAG